MSLATRPAQTLTNPVGIDAAIAEINGVLLSRLSWLNNAFGKCEKLQEKEGKGNYPAIYASGNEYISLFPDSNLSNFSFFDVSDRSVLNWVPNQLTAGKSTFGLVVWFDFRKVYPTDHETKSIENVKFEVLEVLNTSGFLNCKITAERVLERIENVYNGYNLAQYRGFSNGKINSPYQMRPYGVFRIEGIIHYQKNC